MSDLMRQYLELERLLLTFDEDSPTADALRDAMDPIWLELTDEDRERLNDREFVPTPCFDAISVPAAAGVFCDPPERVEQPIPKGEIRGWRMSA